MKLIQSFWSSSKLPLIILSIISLLAIALNRLGPAKHHDHDHDHHSYSDYGPGCYPSKIPDQIILNLTEDPMTSVAVNWRTDTTIRKGEVQVNEASHNANLLGGARTIIA